MQGSIPLVEIWRGDMVESLHTGHAVICDDTGAIVEAWGDPTQVIYPRSACKMIQALPLVETGAADAAGLGTEHLALSCASHNGAAMHTERVTRWLAELSLGPDDLRCGPQMPEDPAAKESLMCSHTAPGQEHNNCSGKHSGFLTLCRHIGAGPEYVESDHPVQRAVRAAFEEVTGETSPRFAIDGCSAPNFATSLHGLARAMARFASADEGDARGRAMTRLEMRWRCTRSLWRVRGGPARGSCGRWAGVCRSRRARRASSSRWCPSGGWASRSRSRTGRAGHRNARSPRSSCASACSTGMTRRRGPISVRRS
jgi:L-asparaginase II